MYSLKDYMVLFNNSKFKIDYLRKNMSNNKFSLIFKFLSKFKFIEEYFTFNIFTILKK